VLVSGVLVTFQMAFVGHVDLIGSIVVYAIDGFFLADVLRNFRIPYRERGTEVVDPAAIARHYRHSTFAIDLVAATPFDLLLLPWQDVTVGGVSIVLCVRLLRLLRVVRMFVVFGRWEQQTWSNAGYLRIARLVAAIILVLHVVACAWFVVPVMEGLPADSWPVREDIAGVDVTSQYIRSLYWVIVTTTTVGFGDITPHRNVEYVFTMFVMLLGASMYAFVIGSIASLVSRIDSAKGAFWDRVETVTQYLRARRVPAAVNAHVRDYYEYVWATYRGTDQHALLRDLPEATRLDVLDHLTKDLLADVPLFRHSPPALRHVLLLALQPAVYAPGDDLIREGEVADGIYFLSRGTATVLSANGQREHGSLEAGDYFGELSLVLGERRTGSVRAASYCDTFVMPKQAFERIKQEYPEFRELLKRIAAEKSETRSALVLDGVVL
jgi:hypothetical protein